MRVIDKLYQIERIDNLIRRKATGSPKDLASRLGVSERTIYDCIDLMKSMDAPIYYCRHNQSYCYDNPVRFSFGFKTQKPQTRSIFGGNRLYEAHKNYSHSFLHFRKTRVSLP